ncbi:MFS general substrate transporter [Meredithblackwellia eburnea MCA 4105]
MTTYSTNTNTDSLKLEEITSPTHKATDLASDTAAPLEQEEREEQEEQEGNKTGQELEQDDVQEPSTLLKGKKLVLVTIGMMFSIFLVSLDETILAPALPTISSQFHSLDRLAWIASAYFLAETPFLLFWGQVLTLFDVKRVFLLCVGIFEVGSIICGSSTSINVLIFGRAVSGAGAAGIFISCIAILTKVTTLQQRPIFMGVFGAMFVLSTTCGPLLGGVLTDRVTWRLCFYINLPFGVLALTAIIFFVKPSPAAPMSETLISDTRAKLAHGRLDDKITTPRSVVFRLVALDWVGTVLVLGAIACLVLALDWGGVTYAWSNPRIISLLIVSGILTASFISYEVWARNEISILPLRFFGNRTIVGAALEAFFIMMNVMLATFFLPLYFQATRGASAERSAILMLPFILGILAAVAIASTIITKVGYYKPFLILGPLILSVGSGILYTIKEHTPISKLVGYQLILAMGMGFAMDNTVVAVQAELQDDMVVPQASAVVTFTQLLGGTCGLALANAIYGTWLSRYLRQYAPDAPFDLVRNSVAAIRQLPKDLQPGVITAYVRAINNVFVVGVGVGVLGSLAGCLVRNHNIRTIKKEKDKREAEAKKEKERREARVVEEVEASAVPV